MEISELKGGGGLFESLENCINTKNRVNLPLVEDVQGGVDEAHVHPAQVPLQELQLQVHQQAQGTDPRFVIVLHLVLCNEIRDIFV